MNPTKIEWVKGWFQSLSGFFRPCNTRMPWARFTRRWKFQSLSGFFRPCNPPTRSILPRRSHSFNPCRVFSGLATQWVQGTRWSGVLFQSLSGFFRPCNSWVSYHPSSHWNKFQSLSGFFRPCNVSSWHRARPEVGRFNPCRVFSGLATPRSDQQRREHDRFNPCRVFSGLATTT